MTQPDKPLQDMTTEEIAEWLYPPPLLEALKEAANPPEEPKEPKRGRSPKNKIP